MSISSSERKRREGQEWEWGRVEIRQVFQSEGKEEWRETGGVGGVKRMMVKWLWLIFRVGCKAKSEWGTTLATRARVRSAWPGYVGVLTSQVTDKEDGDEESEWYTEGVGVITWAVSKHLPRVTHSPLRSVHMWLGGVCGLGWELDFSRSSHSNRIHTEVKHRQKGGNVPEKNFVGEILLVFACGWRDLTNTVVQN